MRPSPSTLCTWATTTPDSSDSRLCISMPQLLPFEVLGYKEHKALREAVQHLLRFDGRIETICAHMSVILGTSPQSRNPASLITTRA